jgi:two-component system, chemotaxis family, chemotaxis protein CheY
VTARIMLVEDDDDLREALAEVLATADLEVIEAHDGQHALDLLRLATRTPALIVLDLMMPVMDGETFLEHQAADDELRRIPVVVLTAQTRRARKLDCSVAAVLEKPVFVPELLEEIRAVVGS